MTPTRRTIAFAWLIAASVCGPASDRRSEARAQENVARKGAKVTRVEVTTPSNRPLTRTLRLPATLLPFEVADLFAKTSGYIAAVHVDIGDRVKAGDSLIEIDVPEMADELRQEKAVLDAKNAKVRAAEAKVGQARSNIAVAQARNMRAAANRDLAKLTLDRKKQLRAENAIAEQDLDDARSRFEMADAEVQSGAALVANARAEVESAEAEVAVARAQVAVERARVARLETLMKYAVIRAPFSGMITDRLVDPGAFVRSAAEGVTTPLLTIAEVGKLRLAMDIPEADTPFVRIGTEVSIVVRAASREAIHATVSRTAGALKPDTRTMRAQADLDNQAGELAPGMYAKVTVKLESRHEAMLIPAKAIRVHNRDVSVWVAEDAIVKSKPIKIGYDDGIWVEVLSGLRGDEQIIVSSNGTLTVGATVDPVPVTASSS